MPTPRTCNGLVGILRGHKFVLRDHFSGDAELMTNCLRCGMPRGGWGSR